MTAAFHEVKRVLRKDGTLWCNMGDCYAHTGACGGESPDGPRRPRELDRIAQERMGVRVPEGLKPKDLVGQPWRLAFALQADGWYLRSDIIWAKPNPMPESVTDRPTKAHEYIFLLSKSPRYFYDQEAVREKSADPYSWEEYQKQLGHSFGGSIETRFGIDKHDGGRSHPAGRNSRTVWEIATQPYAAAHFATFPEELPRRCIKAGTSEKGCCPKCGSPWERITEDLEPVQQHWSPGTQEKAVIAQGPHGKTSVINTGFITPKKSIGWQPTCSCGLTETVPCVVLDPFAGSGTTGAVARSMGRSSILIELNPEYVKLIRERCETNHVALDSFAEVSE
jgi:DNA modification methylase